MDFVDNLGLQACSTDRRLVELVHEGAPSGGTFRRPAAFAARDIRRVSRKTRDILQHLAPSGGAIAA